MTDLFADYTDSLLAPSLDWFAITPDDSVDLPKVIKALYVGEGGDVVLRTAKGSADVTFRNLPSGSTLDVRAKAVHPPGTTAASLVGLA